MSFCHGLDQDGVAIAVLSGAIGAKIIQAKLIDHRPLLSTACY
jgi:hypothetical protein